MPVTQHHPENQDNIIPSVLDSPFHSHNCSIKKASKCWQEKVARPSEFELQTLIRSRCSIQLSLRAHKTLNIFMPYSVNHFSISELHPVISLKLYNSFIDKS